MVKSGSELLPKYISCISTMDLITRLLYFTDVTTNSGNFGFVEQGENNFNLKIVDFATRNLYSGALQGVIEGFKSENGRFNYSDSGAMKQILKDRPLANRITTVKQILLQLDNPKGKRLSFTSAIDQAKILVENLVKQGKSLASICPENAESELN